jgi:GNAT superfamily N-acetyltransferase
MEERMEESNLVIEKDKTGVEVEIRYCPRIGDTPNMIFFLNHFVKMIENGYVHSHFIGNNKNRAIYAVVNNQIVGQITFDLLEDYSKTTWINLSVVDEAFRKRGIYKMMHQQLEAMMLKLGSRKMAGHVHVTNTDALGPCKRMGLKEFYYRIEKEI